MKERPPRFFNDSLKLPELLEVELELEASNFSAASTVIRSVSVHPVTSMTCLAFEPLSSNLAVLVRHSRQDVCRLEKQLGFTHYQRRQRVDATAHTAAAEAEKQPLPLLSNFMNKVVIGMRV